MNPDGVKTDFWGIDNFQPLSSVYKSKFHGVQINILRFMDWYNTELIGEKNLKILDIMNCF